MTKYNIILVIAILVYSITAIFSNGYYHFDEHFQIIEFAELKAGRNLPGDLAWEYSAQIRPALQPAITFIIFSFLRTLGLDNPYYLMIALRVITGITSVLIINFFINNTQHLVDRKFSLLYKVLSYFIWFLPFINVRFSSETFSGLCFIAALATFYSSTNRKYLTIGVLLSLGFMFRFQTAFMTIGFLTWLIFIYRVKWVYFKQIIFSFTITLLFCLMIDFWFYESMTLTPVNYFVSNIIKDIASQYGTSPWYFYIAESLKLFYFPFGILVVCFAKTGQLMYN